MFSPATPTKQPLSAKEAQRKADEETKNRIKAWRAQQQQLQEEVDRVRRRASQGVAQGVGTGRK